MGKWEAMVGGRIWVEPALGLGSRFTFTLPKVTAAGVPSETRHLQART